MNHRICLAIDPLDSGFPVDRSALWVHHPKDPAPMVCARTVDSETFVKDPRKWYAGCDVVVLQNLVSEIIRPGSRLKYGQYLTDPWTGPQRVSVDSHLFIGLPWRMWFHFGAVDAPFGTTSEKYHTSYRVETDWNFWVDGKIAEQPCNIARISKYGNGVMVFRSGFRFVNPKIEIVSLDASQHAYYAKEKHAAFEECRTASSLLKRLEDFAQRICPERSIPKNLFLSHSPEITFTDLGIDRYKLSMIRLMIELTNSVAEKFS